MAEPAFLYEKREGIVYLTFNALRCATSLRDILPVLHSVPSSAKKTPQIWFRITKP